MTKDSSPEVRRCIAGVVASGSEVEVAEWFEVLESTLAIEADAREKAERESRRARGVTALAPPRAAEQAAEFFDAMRAEALAARGSAE